MKQGVLLINMGSPTSEKEMKTFLRRMFSDVHIIPLPYLLRSFVALIISNRRYRNSWKKYVLTGGSPLMNSDKNLCIKLQEELGLDITVRIAFSYSNPGIKESIASLYNEGIRSLHVIPLYPHFSFTTTGSVKREIAKTTRNLKDLEIKLTERFYSNKHFIEYWRTLIYDEIARNNLTKPLLLFSAHSIPEYNIKRGDTYLNEINESAKQIAESCGLSCKVSFQSKIGKVKWVEPDTKTMLKELSEQGIDNILIVPISFLSENLETLFDIDINIIPYAKNMFNLKNIHRVHIPQQNSLLLQTLKDIIRD